METTSKPLSEQEAAEWLGISKTALLEERNKGRIKYYRILRNRIRYTIPFLVEYMENHPNNVNPVNE